MLILREKTNRKGETTRFNVVGVSNDQAVVASAELPDGSYKTMSGSVVRDLHIEREHVVLRHVTYGERATATVQE